MHIIDVVPFVRGAPADTLYYRSKEFITAGTIVSVPLRNRTITAVVIKCIPIRDAKTFLKNASFIPRSIVAKTISHLPNVYYRVAVTVAYRHMSSVGSTLRQLFTNDNITAGFITDVLQSKKFTEKQYESPYEDRVKKYRALHKNINESGTILYVVPSTIEAKRLERDMQNTPVIMINGDQPTRKRQKMILEASDAPVVIVTAPYAFIPIKKLSTIIIERESAEIFIHRQYPYIDMRIALYELAKALGVALVIGDYPIRLEVRMPHKKSLRNKFSDKIHILSTHSNDLPASEQQYTTLPITLRRTIQQSLSKKERVLLMAVRRGYAAATVCRDCGETIRDKYERALSLATQNGKRIFRSTDGIITQPADARCKNCDSWNLIPLGAGIERVEEDIKKYFPDTPYVRFDSDTITSYKVATRALQEARSPGSILLGTEKLIRWLEPEDLFSSTIIVSADSLLAVPFWRARERLVRIVLSLTQNTENMIIATRHKEDAVCKALTQSDMNMFIDEELQLRQTLHYPPYGYLLIFKITGNEKALEQGENLLRSLLTQHIPSIPSDHVITKNKHVRTLIYKLKQFPQKEAIQHIARLPHYITHIINGESL